MLAVETASLAEARKALFARLRERRGEIETAMQTRISGIADFSSSSPTYADGLRAAISTALDYGLVALDRGAERAPPVPGELRAQARLAARSGVSLDTVLRRYFAGYMLLGDFLVHEIERGEQSQVSALKALMRALATVFDNLVTAVTEEYTREAGDLLRSARARRAEQVRRLLGGELLDVSAFDYDFDAWHLGILVKGDGAGEKIRELAAGSDRRLLLVEDGDGPMWAWLGGLRRLEPADLAQLIPQDRTKVTMAIGEPAQGLAGWRLTHRQASAAWPIAQRRDASIVRYADVALLASVLQDDLLVTSLRRLYLEPLEGSRDGGKALRETLRAYFAAERNVSSAASQLGVSRRTVANRLRTMESKLGHPLTAVLTELDVALRLDDLERFSVPPEGAHKHG